MKDERSQQEKSEARKMQTSLDRIGDQLQRIADALEAMAFPDKRG